MKSINRLFICISIIGLIFVSTLKIKGEKSSLNTEREDPAPEGGAAPGATAPVGGDKAPEGGAAPGAKAPEAGAAATEGKAGEKATPVASGSESLQDSWRRLFTDPERTKLQVVPKPEVEKTVEEKKMESQDAAKNIDGPKWDVPKKKENYYAKKMIGWGPSAYLFDFIDSAIKKDVTAAFKNIFELAKKTVATVNYKDPYTLENITRMKGTEDELLSKIESLTKGSENKSNFDKVVWVGSVTVGQVDKLLKEWKWNFDKKSPDPAKSFVDRFDFNGDGRLSPKELIIGMLEINKSILGAKQCLNCLEEIVVKTIDPIFMYIDTSNEEKVNAEMLWNNLRNLIRKKPKTYNFYNCETKNKKAIIRTTTCNDFIIKAKKSIDGYITKVEFRNAILQGYWARHVDDHKVYQDNGLNMKMMRWNQDGTVDKACAAASD